MLPPVLSRLRLPVIGGRDRRYQRVQPAAELVARLAQEYAAAEARLGA